jgi:Tat protein translocase TatB subunit
MFGPIGMPEMIVLGVLALLFFGPRKLPEIGRSLGRSLAEFRRASNQLKTTLEQEIETEELEAARKSAQMPPAPPAPSEAKPTTPGADAGA